VVAKADRAALGARVARDGAIDVHPRPDVLLVLHRRKLPDEGAL
jgi:hypothetical protein